jgi:hypothetical protein
VESYLDYECRVIILTDDSADRASGVNAVYSNAFYLPPPAIYKERQAGGGRWAGEEVGLGYTVLIT